MALRTFLSKDLLAFFNITHFDLSKKSKKKKEGNLNNVSEKFTGFVLVYHLQFYKMSCTVIKNVSESNENLTWT